MMRVHVLAAVLLMVLAVSARAADPISCAIVPDSSVSQTPIPDLLLAEITGVSDLAMIERAQVDQILKEQALQLALGAGDVDARRRLGHLLKAQLIVQLRAGMSDIGGKPQAYLECVISESDHGLRLVHDRRPWNQNTADEETRAVAELIKQSAAKVRQRIQWIFAVPPFESQDLMHRHDHMQSSLAELAMSRLAAQPGVQVVEIEEARALTDESKLTAADKAVRPILSFYVHGKYRNDGDGAALRTSVEMELTQSGGKLDSAQAAKLEPQAVTGFVQSTLDRFFTRATQAQPAPFDAKRECAELEKRAGQFERLGEYKTASALLEASLLIAPNRPELDRRLAQVGADAMKAVGRRTRQNIRSREEYRDAGSNYESALMLYTRGLDHFEIYLRTLDPSGIHPYSNDFPARPLQPWKTSVLTATNQIPAFSSEMIQARHKAVAAVLSWYESLDDQKLAKAMQFIESEPPQSASLNLNREEMHTGFDPYSGAYAIDRAAGENKWDVQVRLIRSLMRRSSFGQIKRAVELTAINGADESLWKQIAALGPEGVCLAEYGRIQSLPDRDKPARLKQLSERVAAEPKIAMWRRADWKKQIAADMTSARRAAAQTPRPANTRAETFRLGSGKNAVEVIHFVNADTTPTSTLPEPIADADVTFTQIKLFGKTPAANGGFIVPGMSTSQSVIGWLNCGNGVDLVWTRDQLFALRQKGRPEPLMNLNRFRTGRIEIVYDGKRAWVYDDAGLAAVDPAGGVDKINPGADFPPGDLWLAPLGVGKLCVVGRADRTWCGTFEYQGAGKYKLDVFHEARLQTGEPADAGVAFRPGFLRRVDGPDGAVYVMATRQLQGRAGEYPLIVDPAHRTAFVTKEIVSRNLLENSVADFKGGVVWMRSPLHHTPDLPGANASGSERFVRFGPPDWKPAELPRAGNLFSALHATILPEGDCLVLASNSGAFVFDTVSGEFVPLKAAMPRTEAERFIRTSHYGVVLMMRDGSCWQVEFKRQPREIVAAKINANKTAEQLRHAIAGHPLVYRVYDAAGPIDRAGEKREAALGEKDFELDLAALPRNYYIVVLGEDQTDPAVRNFLGGAWCGWLGGRNPSGRARIELVDLEPKRMLFTDGNEQPLAGVELNAILGCNSYSTPKPNQMPLRIPIGRADSAGLAPPQIRQITHTREELFAMKIRPLHQILFSLEAVHPELGKWFINEPSKQNTIPASRQKGAGEMRGRILDAAGKPVAGAEIRVSRVLLPDGKSPFMVLPGGIAMCNTWQTTRDDGAFNIMIPKRSAVTPRGWTQYILSVSALGDGVPPMNALVLNDVEHDIRIGEPRDTKLEFIDENGAPVTGVRGRLKQVFEGVDGKFDSIDFSSTTAPSTPVKLWPGQYELEAYNYTCIETEYRANPPAIVFRVMKR